MSDLTVHAENLISNVVRAFYDDDAVCLIDVLIRDKFLRDDDMAPRLHLPAKKLRATLQFLQEEHLVQSELVDDLAQGGSQATKFWYIDYNHAVHSIRLRLHLLRKELEQAEMRARSSSFYLCPGYQIRRCNGRYSEEEAQHIVVIETGLFLCQECNKRFEFDPNAPPKKDYTLHLVDNTKDLKLAVDNVRRVNVQLNGKMIGNQQLRPSIYDLVQKVRGKGKEPIISNLPSENYALGRGSKRLAGTGRTAGIKARKLEQQGVAGSALAARNILVGGEKRSTEGSDLTFLKNAMGNEIGLRVEKGGGARANLLATRKRRQRKLLDAAATRVGSSIPLDYRVKELARKRKDEKEKAKSGGTNGSVKNNKSSTTNGIKKDLPEKTDMDWLNNNISRQDLDLEMERMRQKDMEQNEFDEDDADDDDQHEPSVIVLEDLEEAFGIMDEEVRKATFQALYSREMNRQQEILHLKHEAPMASLSSPSRGISTDSESITWEDG